LASFIRTRRAKASIVTPKSTKYTPNHAISAEGSGSAYSFRDIPQPSDTKPAEPTSHDPGSVAVRAIGGLAAAQSSKEPRSDDQTTIPNVTPAKGDDRGDKPSDVIERRNAVNELEWAVREHCTRGRTQVP
jgi:hypothetical protein